MKQVQVSGWLTLRDFSEATDVLFLDDDEWPLLDNLEGEINGKTVSARYWITDKKVSRKEASSEFLKSVMGYAECEFTSHYSDVTGYLWTDEELRIGCHDLLAELESHAGKFLVLEIDIHDGS